MNMIRFTVMGMLFICVWTGCKSSPTRLTSLTKQDSSCGPDSLSIYARVRGITGPHQIKDIYELVGKELGGPVSMLDLKNAALKIGFSAEGYILDINNLEGLESYAILPVGQSKGSSSDPLHFILVRFSKGKVFAVDSYTLEEKPLKILSLNRIWRGHALLLSTERGE